MGAGGEGARRSADRWTGLLWMLAGLLAAAALALAAFKLTRQPPFLDFLTMWTGGRMARLDPASLYDPGAIDRAQAWLLGAAAHDRPFPYPPSALLIFAPLALAPFALAAWLWTVGGMAAFAAAIRGLDARRKALACALTFLSPPAVWAAISGQCAFLIGALAVAGLRGLARRPLVGGALIGAAVALKPSVLIMAPVALIGSGAWRALAGAAAGGAAVSGLSALFFGPGPWAAWIVGAPAYLAHITGDPRYASAILAPAALGARLGLAGKALAAWQGAFAVAGLVLAVGVFRRTPEPAPRLAALVGGSFLATPYAMNYEATLLAPAAVAALLAARDGVGRALSLAAFAALCLAGLPGAAAPAFLAWLGLTVAGWLAEGRGSTPAGAHRLEPGPEQLRPAVDRPAHVGQAEAVAAAGEDVEL